jgi:hypothetical protein
MTSASGTGSAEERYAVYSDPRSHRFGGALRALYVVATATLNLASVLNESRRFQYGFSGRRDTP